MRLTVVIILLLMQAGYTQNTPQDIYNTVPFYDETNMLLSDGDVVQVIYAGNDQAINQPVMNIGQSSNGQTTGDDMLLSSHSIGENMPPGSGMFYVTITAYATHDEGYPAAGDYIYVRIFNHDELLNATFYGDGQLHLVTNQLGNNYEVQLPGGILGTPLPIVPA